MKELIKVLMVCTVEFDKNGIATYITNNFEKIVSERIQIDIVAPNVVRDVNIKNLILEKNMKLYELPMRRKNTLCYFGNLFRIIKKRKYDIIHVHGNSCTMAIELFAALLAGCKVRIAHSHNTTCLYKKVHAVMRPLFELSCTERLACSYDAGKWLFHGRRFTVVENGIDVKKFRFNENIRAEMREKLKVTDNEILLGHVGVFNYQKNQEFLILLMKTLKELKSGKFKMVLVGDGENEKNIKLLIKKYGLEDCVILAGKVSNVNDFMNAMDCFLLPSRFEGFPYVLIEAQVSGLPCIVSDTVTENITLNGLIHFLSIDKGVNCWVEELLLIKLERKNCISLENFPYNLDASSDKLKKIYEKFIS